MTPVPIRHGPGSRLFSIYIPLLLAIGAGMDVWAPGGSVAAISTLVSIFVAAIFGFDLIQRARSGGFRFLRAHWFDTILTVLLILLVEERVRSGFLQAAGPESTPGYLILFYLLGAAKTAARSRQFTEWREKIELRPAQAAVAGFALVILLGTIILSLPAVTRNGIGLSLTDALFMSTSAVCVTGLIVVDPYSTFNPAGQIAIMLLIQIGGLGIMTLGALLPMLLLRRLALKDELSLSENLGLAGIGSVQVVLLAIFFVTLGAETLGTLLLWRAWAGDLGIGKGLYFALFHSISAFNNAGFSLFPDSLMRYVGNPAVNLTVTSLVILGGIGFPVWVGIGRWIGWPPIKRGPRPLTTTHLKVTVWTTAALLLGAFLIFLPLEWSHSLRGLSWGEKLWAGWFQAVTPRTAGFNTVDTTLTSSPMRLIFIILMFIGGSPGGTAGGIKVTTAAVMLFAFRAYLSQKKNAVVFRRSIHMDQVQKCLAIVFISLPLVLVPTILLLVTENLPFDQIVFEAYSAFGTVGLSLGATPALSNPGRLIVTLLMFVGRLGPMTMAFALSHPAHPLRIEYPEGKIMIG